MLVNECVVAMSVFEQQRASRIKGNQAVSDGIHRPEDARLSLPCDSREKLELPRSFSLPSNPPNGTTRRTEDANIARLVVGHVDAARIVYRQGHDQAEYVRRISPFVYRTSNAQIFQQSCSCAVGDGGPVQIGNQYAAAAQGVDSDAHVSCMVARGRGQDRKKPGQQAPVGSRPPVGILERDERRLIFTHRRRSSGTSVIAVATGNVLGPSARRFGNGGVTMWT